MTASLRILAVAPYVPEPPDHGGRVRTRLLLEELRRRGHRVELLALAADAAEAARAAALTAAGLPTRALVVPRRFGRLGWRDRLRKLHRLVRGCSDLLGRFRPRRLPPELLPSPPPDVVLAEVLWAAPTALRVPAGARVLDAHNVESLLQARAAARLRGPARWLARLEARCLARAERDLARRFDRVAVVSRRDRESLRRLGVGVPIAVVPNVVAAVHSPPLAPPPPGPLTCLFVGSLQYPPNADGVRYFAREILPELRRGGREVRFLVAGGDAPRDLAGFPGVTLLGYVPELREVYGRAHVVVVPLRVGGGTRTKVLEAFAYGRPVVSTPLGVEGLPVRPGRHYLAAEAPAAFAAAVLRAAADAALRDRLVRAARRRAEAVASPAAAGARLEAVLRRAAAPQEEPRWSPS